MKKLLIAMLLSLAPLANAQPLPLPPGSPDPPPPGEMVAPPKQSAYLAAYAQAEKEKKHAVIYVGADAPIVGTSVRADDYNSRPGIYIILHDGKKLSDYHLRFALGTDVSTWLAVRAASPFAQPEVLPKLPVGDAKLPPKGEKYVRSKYSQSISVTDGRDRISTIFRRNLASWVQQSGGMEGVGGYRSEVYRSVPSDAKAYVANLPVWNGSNFQYNRGWTRSYPDGTRFDDVLSNTETGKIFEHRVAVKRNGEWSRKVIFRDVAQYPAGYEGLRQSCSSCHEQAGTGGYATGMIPGSDTIFSDPFEALER